MKKLLLLILTIHSLVGMQDQEKGAPTSDDHNAEGYTYQQCLLELRQIEVALETLRVQNEMPGSFMEVCSHCAQKQIEGGYLEQCENCGKDYDEDDILLLLKNNALKTILRNQRALLSYKKK